MRFLNTSLLAVTITSFILSHSAFADDTLPDYVKAKVNTPLTEVGSGTYRKFGFRVYNAELWSPNGTWDPQKPYVLQLHYTRSLSKDTLVDTVMDDIRDQNVADEATFARWDAQITKILPAVEDGDTITGVALPGKNTLLFYNGKQIASIHDDALSKAFFDIWLGDQADENLRGKLLNLK